MEIDIELFVNPGDHGLAVHIRNLGLDPLYKCQVNLERLDRYVESKNDFTRNPFEPFRALYCSRVNGQETSSGDAFATFESAEKKVLTFNGAPLGPYYHRTPMPRWTDGAIWLAEFSIQIDGKEIRRELRFLRWKPGSIIEAVDDPRQPSDTVSKSLNNVSALVVSPSGLDSGQTVAPVEYDENRDLPRQQDQRVSPSLVSDSESGHPADGEIDPVGAPNAHRGNESSPDLCWEDIHIRFLSDERIEINSLGRIETRNYGELRFADGRDGKPNGAWETLRSLAESGGTIHDGSKLGVKWTNVEKRVQEIRQTLRTHFRIAHDPIPHVRGTGYRALFRISCSPSYHT